MALATSARSARSSGEPRVVEKRVATRYDKCCASRWLRIASTCGFLIFTLRGF
jgi:hypothetical protein